MAAFVASMAFHYLNPEKVYIEPQKDQLVEFNGENYSKDELIAKVKAGQSRVAEAYTFGAFFCKEMVGKDGGGFKFANSVSSVQGMTIIVDMDCHTMDGGMQKYRTTFDQERGTIVTSFRSGPSLAA